MMMMILRSFLVKLVLNSQHFGVNLIFSDTEVLEQSTQASRFFGLLLEGASFVIDMAASEIVALLRDMCLSKLVAHLC